MPRKLIRPDRRAEIPAHIQRVAERLFRSHGYAHVTMEQIAGQAAVSKRTLYKYFAVKETLLERVLEDELATDLAQQNFHIDGQAGFRSSVLDLLHGSAQWCEQHTDYLLPYIRHKFATFDPSAAAQKDTGLLPVWQMLIATAQERGELRAERSAEQLGTYFHYLYLGALMRWLTEPRLDLRKEFDMVVALFVDGAG
ncbi:TetR/AcrR family transcriptional regulator [Bordetella muralis]|uniref:TetR/AcrR family transcriptional regulator n=1 Tax=Bordetella muralis TaxID=1649130 RepID=UPI0039F07C0A